MIDRVRRRFGHAPGVVTEGNPRGAGGAYATTFAGVGNQEIVLALVAVRSGESMCKDAAFEIAAKCALDMGRRCFTVLAAGELQPGFEVGLDDAIPQRPLGTAARARNVKSPKPVVCRLSKKSAWRRSKRSVAAERQSVNQLVH